MASSVIEYYRQFAFVSSVLAGFAFTFYGVLLSASAQHRATNLAALLAVMPRLHCLLVTLGMTFAARSLLVCPNDARCLPRFLRNRRRFLFVFLLGSRFCSRPFRSWGMDSVVAHWVSPTTAGSRFGLGRGSSISFLTCIDEWHTRHCNDTTGGENTARCRPTRERMFAACVSHGGG